MSTNTNRGIEKHLGINSHIFQEKKRNHFGKQKRNDENVEKNE